jgi:hypothetical protein
MARGVRTILAFAVGVTVLVVVACTGNDDAPDAKKLGGAACADDRECESALCLAGTCTGGACDCHTVSGFFGIGSSVSCSCRESGYACTGTACRQKCGGDAGACPSGMKCTGSTCWLDVRIERREPQGVDRVPQGTSLHYVVEVLDSDRMLVEWRIDKTTKGTLTGRGSDIVFDADIESAQAKLDVTITMRDRGANLGFASTTIDVCAPLGEPCVIAKWNADTYPPCCTGECANVRGTEIRHCVDPSLQDAGVDAAPDALDAAPDGG